MANFPEGGAVVFGASGGLGGDVARKMAARGSRLALAYRTNRAAIEPLMQALADEGVETIAVACDVRDGASVSAALAEANDRFGRVHSVVNAAGSVYSYHSVVKIPEDEFRHVLETDVIGFLNIARAAVPLMRKAGGGSIVTVGTAGVARTSHGNSLSAIPKSAVNMMVHLLALEEGRHNIRVNWIGAGVYRAGMTLAMIAEGRLGTISPDDFGRDTTALRRIGEVEEFGGLAAFLCTEEARYITGQTIFVDGGMSV